MVFVDILWLCVMLYLSHASGEHTARQSRELHRITRINEKVLRVVAHLVCYMVLGVLWAITVDVSIWLAALIPVAVIDEGTKQFIKGRHTSYPEMGLNILGAAIGVSVVILIKMVMNTI